MLIVTANIRNNPDMAPDKVRADVRTIRRMNPDLVGWQEIGELEDRHAIDQAFTPDRYALAGRDMVPVPVTVDIDRLDILAKPTAHRLTKADRDVPQPARWCSVVDMEDRHSGAMVRHLNCHLTNGAWNGAKPATERERRDLWRDQFADVRRLVRRAVADEWVVIVTGDFNRRAVPELHPRLRWAAGVRAIDKIGVIATRDTVVRAGRAGVLNARDVNTDHRPRWAQVSLVRLDA